ncbi:radical SAM protein, partial [Enterococcus hirae]
MTFGDLVRVVGRLKEARVANVTLTGGEPFVHEQLLDIARLLVEEDMDVTICTNGVAVSQADVDALVAMRRVSVNLSLDGFSAESHGRF